MKKRKIACYEKHMIETLKTFTDAINADYCDAYGS